MATPDVGIQLIVFGERNQTDIGGVLNDVAQAGFGMIEAGNMFESYGEGQVRDLLDKTGLSVCGAHFGYGDYSDPARLRAHINYCKAMGIRNMMCSGVADTSTAQGYRDSCALFNAVGAQLRDEGITFNYHNHAFELDDLGGVIGMEILAQETDSAVVKFNIDVFWVTIGGQDPAEFIRTHANRAGYFHFKDGQKDSTGALQFLELGRGEVDLTGAYAAACEAGIHTLVAEQDRTELPHTEAVAISRGYITDHLGL